LANNRPNQGRYYTCNALASQFSWGLSADYLPDNMAAFH
jgi:hypothetical protein